jgi:hypothetical protein
MFRPSQEAIFRKHFKKGFSILYSVFSILCATTLDDGFELAETCRDIRV